MDLKGRNFLKLMDYTPEEILYLVDLAADLKEKKKKGKFFLCGFIFEKVFYFLKKKKKLVLPGFEPGTFALSARRTTNCAIAPLNTQFKLLNFFSLL